MNQELPKPLRDALAGQTAGDVHPSPDALTAFVEHNLPNRESQSVSDHLASCADCREVVFLASSAVEELVGEEQEWMPAAAVPRISPALRAKTAAAPNVAVAAAVGTSSRRGWMLRWAWVPAIAVVVLVSAVLVRRSQFGSPVAQSTLTMASKGPLTAATNTPKAPAAAPEPDSAAKLAVQKPLAKSARAQTNPARTSDTLASAAVASKAAEQYANEPVVTATPKQLSPPAPNAIGGAYKSAPPAVARQNSFVESEAPNASSLTARSHATLEKSQMGILPAVVTHRQWHITPDGHLERSTTPGNWTPVLADQPATFHVVSVVGDDVWAGGSGGVLFHSSNGGQNWSKVVLSSPLSVETGTIVSISFSDVLNGVVTTEAGSHWTTSDGGTHWTKQ